MTNPRMEKAENKQRDIICTFINEGALLVCDVQIALRVRDHLSGSIL